MKELKKYEIILIKGDDGKEIITRTNDGFLALELLGIASQIQYEVNQMIAGQMKPDRIERVLIDRPSPTPEEEDTPKNTQ